MRKSPLISFIASFFSLPRLLPLFLSLLATPTFAGIVAQWDFTGQNGAQDETPSAPISGSTITASPITRGEGLQPPSPSDFTRDSMAFMSPPGITTLDQAIERHAYFEITLSPAQGQSINLGSLAFTGKIPTKKWGPLRFAVRTSLDAFATDTGGVHPTASATSDSPDIIVTFDQAIQSVTQPLTLRFYCYGSDLPGTKDGLWVIGNSTLTGTFVISDEPSITQSSSTLSPLVSDPSTHPQVRQFTDARKKLSVDPYRPLYHFVTPEGLLNDPNGLCQWQGKYHLFYQLRPSNDKNFHWAHAYSTDLVHWKDLPLAISPSIERQVYSGQTLVEKDRVIAMYHGTKSGNFIATADDPLLIQWKKIPGNPVIPLATTDADGQPVRIFDPDIWKEADGYYALSGTYEDGIRGPGKTAKMVQHLFHSPDLTTWRYLFPLVEGREWTDPGEDGAVPRFLPITPEKHILFFFSHARAAQYLIGHYDTATHKFTPEIHGRFNFGPWLKGSLHAPGAFIDDSGRLIAIFNMRENMTSAAQPDHDIPANAWYGTMTIPRHLTLTGDTLRMVPIPELETLRTDHQQIKNLQIPADQTLPLEKITGKSLEIDATFDPATTTAREFGLEVFRSPDGQEKTTITIYRDNTKVGSHHIGIDVSHSTLRPDVASRPPEIAPVVLPAGQPIRLRAFLDQSILEVFVNDTQALAIRVYPSRADSHTVAAFARGGPATLTSLDAWRMRSIY